MLFFSYQFAGDQWLASRLNLFARNTPGQRLAVVADWQPMLPLNSLIVWENPGCDVVLDESFSKVVNLVRNPLSMLASLNQDRLSSERPIVLEAIQKMTYHAQRGDEQSILNVRIEDFAAFPVVKLRSICSFFGEGCSVEMVRAFLDADRPIRRSIQHIRLRRRSSAPTGVSPLSTAGFRTEASQEKNHDKLDLFSWVDRVSAAAARDMVDRYEGFFAKFYPEVHRVCGSGDFVRRVG